MVCVEINNLKYLILNFKPCRAKESYIVWELVFWYFIHTLIRGVLVYV